MDGKAECSVQRMERGRRLVMDNINKDIIAQKNGCRECLYNNRTLLLNPITNEVRIEIHLVKQVNELY